VQLDQQTWHDAKVVAEMEQFVPVKINTHAQPEVATEQNISGTPTVLFLASDGKEVDRVVGFLPPEEMIKKMQAAREDLPPAEGADDAEPAEEM
jgi:thioredoxin-like negative regulator of GroEL